MAANNKGCYGELLAARYLRKKGIEPLCANFRTRFGEIDIIAQDGEYIIFVEVKTRTGNFSRACEAVDEQKQKKIIAAACSYLSQNECGLQPRFDVMEVYLFENGKVKKINHIKNAFDAEASCGYF